MVIGLPLDILCIASIINYVMEGASSKEWIMWIAFFSLTTICNAGFITVFIKHYGRIKFDEQKIEISKFRYKKKFKIEDIRWVYFSLDYTFRRGYKFGKEANLIPWKCTIRLKGEKRDIPIFIKNKAILKIITDNELRIMPEESKEFFTEKIKNNELE